MPIQMGVARLLGAPKFCDFLRKMNKLLDMQLLEFNNSCAELCGRGAIFPRQMARR